MDILKEGTLSAGGVLAWLDGSPARFWVTAWSVFAVAAAVAVGAALPWGGRRWWCKPGLFVGLSLLSILAFRWPILFDNRELQDPDESQMMSGALTLSHDSTFWRSVDGTTHGPLVDWPLLGALRLTGTMDYTEARTVSALLAWLEILCAWLVLAHFFGDGLGRVLVLPLFAMHAFTDFWNFTQYSSEHAPDAMIALASVLLVTAWDSSGRLRPGPRLFAAGLVLGAVPFGKLQLAPVAAWVAVFGFWQICRAGGAAWGARLRTCAAFAACGLAVPALTLLWIWRRGLWPDFYESYLLDNLRYAGSRSYSWAETPGRFFDLCAPVPDFGPYFLWLSCALVCALFAWRWIDRWHRRWAVFAVGLVLASIYAAMAPGRPFPHYLQVMIFPAGLAAGLLAGAVIEAALRRSASSPPARRACQALILAAVLALGLAPQIHWRIHENQADMGSFAANHGMLQRGEVAREVLKHARPGEALGIWGWYPTLWIQTGMVQATRDGNNWRQLEYTGLQPYYRARYMADLTRSRPPVLVDAAGEGNFAFSSRANGHECFSELDGYLRSNYRLAADVKAMRVYVRNDRP
jgi:hypothetical protein